MRSSIACLRCRRSKVKCLNEGPGTPCRACQTNGRECTYPEPLQERTHRRDTSSDRPGDGGPITPDVPKVSRSKSKKTPSHQANLQSMRALVDALDPVVLTPVVWMDLLDIWERHFAGDFPFLHPPTFQNILRQAKVVPSIQDFNTPRQDASQSLPPVEPEFLLAFLALTSKYQPNLVTHHSNRTPNPRAASEYYATACKSRLAFIDSQSPLGAVPSLARVQTYLMLTLYEWGNCEGINAWNHLSQAIREAQSIGLTDGQDNATVSKNSIVRPITSSHLSASKNLENDPIEKETRNRTFWCCFILERFLSSGEYRPLSLRLHDVKVELPISQPSFLFGKTIRTLLLSESFEALKYLKGDAMRISKESSSSTVSRNGDEMNVDIALESGPTEGVLSRFVKATEVFNAVVHWACAGGRLNEKHAPWDDQSTWRALYRAVSTMSDKLPRDLSLTQSNISAHNSTRSLVPFTLLHTMLLLSKLILHREWLPFLPVKNMSPKGPIERDMPFMVTSAQDIGPFQFWDQSARELFRSARSLLDLLSTAAEWKVLPETPLVAFASFHVALLGLYSTHFPWMDAAEQMSKSGISASGHGGALALITVRDADIARKASDLVVLTRPSLKMAENWFQTLQRTHRYFLKVKKTFRKNCRVDSEIGVGKGTSAINTIVDMGTNEEYRPLDAIFGKFQEDIEMADTSPENGAVKQQSSSLEGPLGRDELTWSAINATPTSQSHVNGAGHASTGGISINQAQQQTPQTPLFSTTSTHSQSLPQIPPFTPTLPTPSPTGVDSMSAAAATATPAHHPTAPWNAEQVDMWLETLETKFGAYDVAAFVEGVDAREFAGVGGWLGAVWGGVGRL